MKKILSIISVIVFLFPMQLLAADVSTDSTLPTSLLSYWSLEETTGSRIDTPGTFDLTDNNSTGYGTGKQGNAADFTPNDNLSIAEQSSLRYTGSVNLSASFWFKADTVSGVQGLVGMYNGTSDAEEWLVYLNGTSLILLVRNQGAAVTWSSSISTGTWYHVVVTMNSSNAYSMKVNNGTAVTGSGASGTFDVPLTFRIGAYGIVAAGHFNGMIDEVGIWQKVLSDTEITTLYQSGSGIPYSSGGGGSPTPQSIPVLFE